MSALPRSLFGRTAVLIATTLVLFAIIAWQAIVWSVVVPASSVAAEVLRQRGEAALTARRTGSELPQDTRFETQLPTSSPRPFRFSAYAFYIESIRHSLTVSLHASDVRLERFAAPAELWVRTQDAPDSWLVLSWRVASPRAPMAAIEILVAAALIVLGAAALSARRLTAPLAALAQAAADVSEGRNVQIDTTSGPEEVRALAGAFASMSQRLGELDEQRELMLAGISHDLRTPLARIRVAIELVEGQDPALVEEMTASVTEMDRMVGLFLHYVRANYRETPVPASLDQIILQTVSLQGIAARVRLDLHAAQPRRIPVDCVRHTLINLVQNALEYGTPPVIVRTALTDHGVRLSVEDAGVGLDPAQWQEALKPFNRLQVHPGGGHSGLGLALVERLSRSCGGTLSCERIAAGFIIRIDLPGEAGVT